MKRLLKVLVISVFILLLSGCAKSSETMKGIYKSLKSPDSTYMALKTRDVATLYKEKLRGDTITISAEGNYLNGYWDYTLDGDYITYTATNTDYLGSALFTYLIQAIGDYLGMDPDLFSGYVGGISALNIENDYFIVEQNPDNSVTYKIYVTGKYDMPELETMHITKEATQFNSLTDNATTAYLGIGKIRMTYYGTKKSCDIIFAEYEELSNLTYKSIINVVKKLKPNNYKNFIKNYTKLKEQTTKDYSVSYLTDENQIINAFGENNKNFKYIKIHFGK